MHAWMDACMDGWIERASDPSEFILVIVFYGV
jgi:hypothetical protein